MILEKWHVQAWRICHFSKIIAVGAFAAGGPSVWGRYGRRQSTGPSPSSSR